MGAWTENFTQRISKMPMAMVVIPFAVGIFFAECVALPLWVALLFALLTLVCAIALKGWWQMGATALLILAVGALLHTISYRGEIRYNTPIEMVLKVESSSVLREGYTSAEAHIEEAAEGAVRGGNVVIWGDSLTRLRAGDRLRTTTPIFPFRKERERYARLMHHRGFIGSVSMGSNSNYEYIPTSQPSLHDRAVARLQGAIGEGDARSVVLAMSTGERSEIRSELRQSYSAAGASHLLAVSGLHIGIAFMLVNILLFPLLLLDYGNLLRSVLAVALIWLYVWLCGMSPSAVRAAIMFSMLQFALSSMREYISVNILAGTAFVMLALDTHLLFDISFQLSFVAVAGIVLWAMPLYMLCATRFRVVNSLLGILLVGAISTVATMPLVGSAFGTISLVGILINPVVIILANIIVLAGVMALALPQMGDVAAWAAELQNRVVEWAAALPHSHFEITLPKWGVAALYALFIVVTLVMWMVPQRGKKGLKLEEK